MKYLFQQNCLKKIWKFPVQYASEFLFCSVRDPVEWHFFNHPMSRNNGYINEMIKRNFPSFLNGTLNMIMGHCYNGNPTCSSVIVGLEGRLFANGPGDRSSIPGWVIPKTLKMQLDTSLLNTQQYKVRIKGKVEQSWERSSTLPYTSL